MKKYAILNEGNLTIQVYENNYGKSMEKMNRLKNEIQKDFPFIEDKDCDILVFGGISKKYIPAIRVCFRDYLDKIPTKEELEKKNYDLCNENSSFFYDEILV